MLIQHWHLLVTQRLELLLLLLQYCDFVKVNNCWWSMIGPSEKETQFYVVNFVPFEGFISLYPESSVICHQFKILLYFWLLLSFMAILCFLDYFIIFSIIKYSGCFENKRKHIFFHYALKYTESLDHSFGSGNPLSSWQMLPRSSWSHLEVF